jgi:hypothetical protein
MSRALEEEEEEKKKNTFTCDRDLVLITNTLQNLHR